jgi:hypothetical protein
MHKLMVAIICLLVLKIATAQPADGSTIVGLWQSDDNKQIALMEIIKGADSSFYGKPVGDSGQADGGAALRQLRYNSATKKYTGKMSPPGTSITMDVTIVLEGKDVLRLTAKKMLLTKKILLRRIK